MESKKHISNKSLEAQRKNPETGIFFSVAEINRYVRGDRTPSIERARALSQLTRSKKKIWLDKRLKAQRVEAIEEYAKRTKTTVQWRRGKPSNNKPTPEIQWRSLNVSK